MQFSIPHGSRLLHSLILHFESGIPIQVEDRYILPNFAPGYLDTDFTQTTTYEYLMKIRSDIEQVEQILSAEIPDERIAKLLDTSDHEPVLVLARRTWIDDAVVTSSPTRVHASVGLALRKASWSFASSRSTAWGRGTPS